MNTNTDGFTEYGLVSIIMPCYNGERFIFKAIDSVLKQDYDNWELIVCDDNSTDGSKSIIEHFYDDRINYILNESGNGVASARNSCIAEAKGQYICFLDCDDFWIPEKLSTQIYAMRKHNYNVCHGSYTRFVSNSHGEVIEVGSVISKAVVNYSDMLTGNKIGNLTGIYDVSVIGKVFQEDIGHEDYLMWLNIVKKADALGVASNLAYYRVAENSVSSNKFKAIIWHYNILRHSLGFSSFRAGYFFFRYLSSSVGKRIKLKFSQYFN